MEAAYPSTTGDPQLSLLQSALWPVHSSNGLPQTQEADYRSQISDNKILLSVISYLLSVDYSDFKGLVNCIRSAGSFDDVVDQVKKSLPRPRSG